ncbi:uncharacterized protein LOC109528842 isoform X2 [Hippocampus comes]|uniref:uncharacterized protein LOC109528842 isoform X2 n=1 Tax=Hippocampus comes TaxID=109280 RepID=UPI00094E66B3|nr:PREDICTED: calcium-responsive transcription factor isoform X2 [Hippocampus comes]
MEESDDDPVLSVVKWEDFLQDYSKDGDYIHGFVTTESSVDNVLELYRKATKTTFCTRRSSSLQVDPLKCKNKKFCTRSFVFCRTISPRITDDGVPFTYGGMKTLECQYGPKREHRRKSDIESTCSDENMRSNNENTASCGLKRPKKRLSAGVTKKKGCQAKISVWHICRLPEYVVTAKRSVTIWQTKAKERLLQDLEIIQWIEQLVDEGITTTRDVQAVLRHNVQTKMSDGVAPDEQHRAYYPTLKDIANHVYKAKVKRQAVNEAKSDDIATTLLLLDASRSLTEDAHHSHHAASYSDEAVWKVRTELHEELNAMWVSSTNCTDAVPLAELKTAIKALHDQFVANLAELRHTPKHQEESAATSALSPAKMARVDNNLYAYLTLQD